MQTAIIASKKDTAGMNIRDSLLDLFNFKETKEKFDSNPVFELEEDNKIKLYATESVQIHAEDIDKKINADLFLFTSRHSASSGLKTLSCHPIGNFGKAGLGGRENRLCIAPANFLKEALIELNKNENQHEATLEATHHGPKTIIKILENNKNEKYESVFVIGGGHYNHVANKVMLQTSYAVGHICAKYNLEILNESLIKEAMEKTLPKAKFVLLDWKGLGKEKQRILSILEKNNIKYERSDKFFKE